MKFKKIRDRLLKENLIRRKDILRAPRIIDEDLLLVHSKDYLNELKNPLMVGKILNLDYVNPWDDYIYEYFRYAAGGTLLAFEEALAENITVFNLGGGFHHAHADQGEGFCLINDVAVAINKMKANNRIKNVLIIDLDYHQGNGNLRFYRNNEDVFTFSIQADNWESFPGKRNNIDVELSSHTRDETYLKILREHLPLVFDQFMPELVVYIAGSDPFIKDTLGDFDISEKGMLKRDRYIYSQIRKRKIPLVVVAGGGYGPESWYIYFNFIKWVIKQRKIK